MGIDVYNGDGRVNWVRVRAAGHGFGICKATQGLSETDARLAQNLAGMKAAGVLRGAYHFYMCQSDPLEQAQHFLDVIQSTDYDFSADLPLAIDLEDDAGAQAIGNAQLRADVAKFLDAVEQVSGRLCLFYVSRSYADEHLDDGFSGHPLWLAEYNSHDQPTLPQAWSTWKIWQYADDATVPGAGTGTVDVDRYNGGLDDLQAWIASGK